MRVARVVPDVPALDKSFDYLVPDDAPARVGSLVRVSLQGRRVGGWIEALDVEPETDPERLRPIAKLSSEGPPADVVALTDWAAWRWAGPRALLLRAASPPNVVAPGARSAPPRWGEGAFAPADDPEVEQAARQALTRDRAVVRWAPALRMAELLRRLVSERGSTLVVVPDVERVELLHGHLQGAGVPALALHARQSDAERTRAWARAKGGHCVVVGGRMAAWAPVPDLAAVVLVDDADEAYKEEQAPTWHARDLLMERARRSGARVTFVTPVPTLESLASAPRPVVPAEARERSGWAELAVVDLREQEPGTGLFPPRLVNAVRRAAEVGRVVCVLNRKGKARLLVCKACEAVLRCEHCRAGLREGDEGLVCDRCGATRPKVCDQCGSTKVARYKPGVERVAEELAALVPRAGVGDDDDAQVLVGTEAALHRVPNAVLVAFLDFDMELLAPRFRAEEQALWLLVRAGRLVGRRGGGGAVLVQTRHPDHPVLEAARAAEPDPFLHGVLEQRRSLRYPPFAALAEVSGVPAAVEALADMVDGVEVLGPVPEGKGLRALLRAADAATLCDALDAVVRDARAEGRLRVEVDPLRA